MKKLAIALALVLLPQIATAEGFYVGYHYGNSDFDTGVDTVVGATLDEEDNGYSLILGNRIDESVSLEGHYADFGEASLSGDSGDTFRLSGTTYAFTTTATIAVSATSMGASGKLHFNMADSLDGYIKAGLHSWETEVTLSAATASATTTDDGVDTLFGMGAEYAIGEKIGLIVGYDRFNMDDDSVTLLYGGVKFDLN